MKTGRRKSAVKARATFPKKAQNPAQNKQVNPKATAKSKSGTSNTAKTAKELLTRASTRTAVKKVVTSPLASGRVSRSLENRLSRGRVLKEVVSPKVEKTVKKSRSQSVEVKSKRISRDSGKQANKVDSKPVRETRSKSVGPANAITPRGTRSKSQQPTKPRTKLTTKPPSAEPEKKSSVAVVLKKSTKTTKKPSSVKAVSKKRKMAESEFEMEVGANETPVEIDDSNVEAANIEIKTEDEVQAEADVPQVKKLKQTFNLTEENPTKSPGEPNSPSSPKKLKGSVAVKFKSWNWTKQNVEDRQQASEGREAFDSSDEEMKDREQEKDEEAVYVQQNNERLRKCSMCLLYIQDEIFTLHQAERCEALQDGDGREYTCSECLASYPSQKLLVRHKRECPRRSQSMYRYQGPRDGKALEGLYSVVWKCHCKQNFSSSEELGKHRSKCKYAQNYTVTCPICNSRILGGQRVLRYHMSKNHPSLFLPNETSSSTILNSLQGTSTMSQIINTKTDDIDGLVKKLTKRHQGASVRVVTVPSKEQQKQEGTDIPITIPINVGQVKKQEIIIGSATQVVAPKSSTADAAKDGGVEIEKQTVTPEVVQEVANMDVGTVEETSTTPETEIASSEKKILRKRKAEQDVEAKVSPRKEAKTSVPKPIAILSTNKDGKVEVKYGPESGTDRIETPVRVSQRNLVKQAAAKQTEGTAVKIEKESPKKPTPVATSTPRVEATGKSKRSTTVARKTDAKVAKSGDSSATTLAEDEVLIEQVGESQEDLRNLLQKAKALTKELEEKLAKNTGNSFTKSNDNATPQPEVDTKESNKPQRHEIKTRGAKRGREAKSVNQASSSKGTDSEGVTPVVRKATPRSGRRYNQVTCLDCRKVFKDHMELGNHKRSKTCPGAPVLDMSNVPDVDLDTVSLMNKSNIKMDVGECYYCTVCPSKFSLRSQLYVHMRDDHKGGLSRYLNFHCPYCPRVFQTVLQRQSHKKERHEDLVRSSVDEYNQQGVGSCDKCYGVFRKEEIDQHEMNCKGLVAEPSIVPFCQLCGQVVENEEKLKLHRQQNHLSAIHFRCSQCTRTFGHALELRCHKVSSHSRTKVDQVYHAMKRMETQKNLKLGKSIKIHISPATALAEDTTVDVPEPKTPSEKVIELTTQDATPTTSAETPMGKIVSSGKGPLNLSKDQMEMLSRGESIKLVIPKSTDMKNLSFAVPSADGKTKKFSLSPKTPEGGAILPRDLTKHFEGEAVEGTNGGRSSPEPQKQLAAALGLQPFDPEHPTQSGERHRPTRLRSGRTIKTSTPSGSKKDKDGSQQTSGRSASESTQEDDPVGIEVITATEALQQAQQQDDVEIIEPSSQDVAVEHVVNVPSTEAGHVEGFVEISEPNGSTVEQQAVVSSPGLAPVQVLKPVGADRVQCMRCSLILGSMLEVANHQCMVG